MGFRFTIKLTEAGRSEYDTDIEDGTVHASGATCGDSGTMCGLHAVDGWYAVESEKPINCRQCENVLLDAHRYKFEEGKFW